MKVGIVAPISFLKECCTTEIQYCLPCLLTESKVYRDFYMERQTKGDYLILDTCKVGWQRRPEAPEVVREALRYITPSIIIAPSYMYDLKSSLRATTEFLESFRPRFVAGCLEGTSPQELLDCANFLEKAKVKVLAVPSYVRRLVPPIEPSLLIHLEHHLHLEEVEDKEGILVTSLPVRLGLQGRLLSDYLPSPPSLTFQEERKFPEVVKRNIAELLEFYKEDKTLR